MTTYTPEQLRRWAMITDPHEKLGGINPQLRAHADKIEECERLKAEVISLTEELEGYKDIVADGGMIGEAE